jgi:hypothetical protein
VACEEVREGESTGSPGAWLSPGVGANGGARRSHAKPRHAPLRDRRSRMRQRITRGLHSLIPCGSKETLIEWRSRRMHVAQDTGVANPTPGKTNLRVKCQTPRESGFARTLTAQHPAKRSENSTAGYTASGKIVWPVGPEFGLYSSIIYCNVPCNPAGSTSCLSAGRMILQFA